MHDLIIAGGGPAGLSAAIMAAQRGLHPVIVEPRPGAIDKACGEGLMPGAVTELAALGVKPAMSHRFVGIRYIADGRIAEGHFPQGPGLGVRRTVLHEALTARADALGIERVQGRVSDIRQSEDRVEAAGLTARWMLAADGLYSPTRDALDLERPAKRRPRFGLRRHYAIAPWSDFVEVYWSAEAEAYVTPVGPNLIGVAVLFSGTPLPEGRGSRDRYERLLAGFPELSERLSQPCTAVRGSGPFERQLSSRRAGRVMLIGDAAGYLDPITGEGIRLGLSSARAALDCIEAGRPEDYDRQWWLHTRRYWWLTLGLLQLRDRPALRRLMVPFLRTVPGAFSRIVGVLAG
ncbi:MAG: NAD(P)/FAD-dependent oxidoreductase [Myxococcota bacterium]|nr:NAD(P)/FAD-dependent oxidoreductase [Myxococcota bacterium]